MGWKIPPTQLYPERRECSRRFKVNQQFAAISGRYGTNAPLSATPGHEGACHNPGLFLSRICAHGFPHRQASAHHRRPVQPLHRLRHRPCLRARRRRDRAQLRGRAFPRPRHRVRQGIRHRPGVRMRRGRRRTDRAPVRTAGPALGPVRRLRARHRLCTARGHRRRLPRRPVAREFPHRARDLGLQLPRAGQGRAAAAAPRRRAADAVVPGRHARGAALQHHGPGQGLARSQRAFPGGRPGQARHPRQRHLGRPHQDPGGQRHQGLRQAADGLCRHDAHPPRHHHRRRGQQRGLPAVRPGRRHQRRGDLRRRRLQPLRCARSRRSSAGRRPPRLPPARARRCRSPGRLR
jgi:hypothetical protein